MKIPARTLLLAALASLATLTVAALAQEKPAPATPDTAAVAAPAAAPADQPAPPPAPTEQTEPPASDDEKSDLRRLDQPDTHTATSEAPAAETVAPAAPDAAPAPAAAGRKHGSRRHSGNERVSVWDDSRLEAGQSAEAVVSVFGSSTSAGEVSDAVVSVFGSSRVTGGSVGDAVVSVLGTSYVNAKVHGEVVAVMGNIELGPQAEVHGQLVCIGGRVIRDPAAKVDGQLNQVSFGLNFGGFEWLHAWIKECLLYARPLAFSTSVLWAWWLALGFFAFYLVLAGVFPAGITKCTETLEQRPGYSILTAFLVTLLAPAAVILLAVTIVGAPVLVVGLVIAGLFGKAAMLAWIGRRITKFFGDGPLAHPFFAVLIGGIILLLLYTVPVVGFVVSKLTSWLGLGIVVYTLILAMQRSKAAVRPVAVAATFPGAVPPVGETGGLGVPPAAASSVVAIAPGAPASLSASTLPRAGFWIRLGASLIDTLLVLVTVNLFPDGWEPNFLLSFALYCVVLWGTKGTTIGGIVCSLKVVRLDDRRVDWPTALVRALGGFVSLVPAGLGFVWVAFDDQRQSWHDKIAGTTVVRAPRGVPLV